MLRKRLDLPASVVSDEALADVLAACLEVQEAHCVTKVRTPALDTALIRRVGRQIASNGIPLGAQNTEFGTMYVPRTDAILTALEAPYLLGGFA